jgi:hypothetical protein
MPRAINQMVDAAMGGRWLFDDEIRTQFSRCSARHLRRDQRRTARPGQRARSMGEQRPHRAGWRTATAGWSAALPVPTKPRLRLHAMAGQGSDLGRTDAKRQLTTLH